MTLKDRLNGFLNVFRSNINPMPLTDESIQRSAMAYCDPLIYHMHDNWLNKISRRMVMLSDPIAAALTTGWAKLATAKTFKFYDTHSPNGQEIMQDYRKWWQIMGLDEVLKACIPFASMDGYCLLDLYITEEGQLGYDVYGSYESYPTYWDRDYDNNIKLYRVTYVPLAQPFGFASGSLNIKSVRKTYRSGELIHYTRGDWNYGLGRSRVLPVWDAITKLRYGSHADFFRRDVRFIGAIPENWTESRAESFMNSLNDFMKSTRRSFIYRMDQSKTPDRTPLDLPRFGYTSMADAAPKPMSQSEAGGALLRDPEWARILAGTGHTENFFIGNQSGAVTGSEVDLTRDFYTECEEFSLIEPLIKQIINWFVNLGMIPPPPDDYVVKYWKDWEHIEMAGILMEQEQQKWEMKQGERVAGETKRKELRQQEAPVGLDHNTLVQEHLLHCIRNNFAMPMTPVKSSWIKKIGFDEGSIYMQTHEQTSKGIDTYEYNPDDPHALWQDWIDSGSKGGFWWDYIRDILSPAFKHGRPPDYLETGYGEDLPYTQSEETREYKIKGSEEQGIIGAGTTRAPYGMKTPTQKAESPFTMPFDVSKVESAWETAKEYARTPTGWQTGYPAQRTGPGRPRSRGKSTTRIPASMATAPDWESKYGVRTPMNPTAHDSWRLTPMNPTIRNQEKQIFNSAAKLKRFAKNELNWGMSKNTVYKIMDLIETYKKESMKGVIRTNSFAYGNGIKQDYPLYYAQENGMISEEYVCPESWKNNVGKTVPLGIYHNLDENSPELPEWQIVGTYTINGWDEETGKDIATLDYDETRIPLIFEKLNEEDWITPILQAGKLPDVSTAYTCDVKYDTTSKKNLQTNIELKSVSFVPTGNCPGNICRFEPEELHS